MGPKARSNSQIVGSLSAPEPSPARLRFAPAERPLPLLSAGEMIICRRRRAFFSLAPTGERVGVIGARLGMNSVRRIVFSADAVAHRRNGVFARRRCEGPATTA